MIKIPVKPLSFNQAWRAVAGGKGLPARNIKSTAYRQYERDVVHFLRPLSGVDISLPLYAVYVFHLWNTKADYDNFIKATQDIIAAKYGFNDSNIVLGAAMKVRGQKGMDSSEFLITNSYDEFVGAISEQHSIHQVVISETRP